MEVVPNINGLGKDTNGSDAKHSLPLKYFDTNEVGLLFGGYNRPTRFEGEIHTLEVNGEVPKEISGTFYRVVPEPQFPPYFSDDIWINGDGMVSSFRIKDGYVDFSQRYVMTEKLMKEREARQALMGRYRNKFTDRVEFKTRSTANVTVIGWKNRLLVLKEDSLPYSLDPHTLQTHGIYDFNGQWKGETFTAHPKYDPKAREFVTFGYEAKGLGTTDNYYGCFDEHGRLSEEVWFKAPYCGFQHEMAITENYVLFPIVPAICDIERMKRGGDHWQWNSKEAHYIGVLPRHGAKSKDVKWFKGPNNFTAHVANSWEEDGKIHIILTQSKENAFYWPDENNVTPPFGTVKQRLAKYIIDPEADDLTLCKPIPLMEEFCEFHKIDERFMGRKNRFIFGDIGLEIDWPYVGPRMGGGYPPMNGIYKLDMETGKYESYNAGPRAFTQEPVFVPRSPEAQEGDGYLIALICDFEEMIGKLVILDTNDMNKPVATLRLPIPMRVGVHGCWVDDTDIDMHPLAPLQ